MLSLQIDVRLCDSSIQAGLELPRSCDKVQSDLVLLSEKENESWSLMEARYRDVFLSEQIPAK